MFKPENKHPINVNSISVSPNSFENLVKGVISQNFDEYWLGNKRNLTFRNKSVEEAFLAIDSDQQFLTFSRQIHLSESLESSSGIFLEGKMRIVRGFLLNLERTSELFQLFRQIGSIYDINNLTDASEKGLVNNTRVFSELWNDVLPKEMIRPGSLKNNIKAKNKQKTRRIIENQQKLALLVRKTTRESKILKEQLKKFSTISRKEIHESGLTGPIARSANIVSPLLHLSPSINRFSATRFFQYATSHNSMPRDMLEVCNVELKLALGRMIVLLPKIFGTINSSTSELKNGAISSSFPLSFGIDHMTLEIEDGQIKNLKFIPYETTNLLGISRLFSKNPPELYPFILLFLNPNIEYKAGQK